MFETLKQIARTVFSDQIRLRRGKARGLHLALAPAGSREFTASELRREEALQAEQALVLRMLEELTALLAASPSLRGGSPHLMQLQVALRDQGMLLLKAMPLPVLTRALAEFEDAVSNWSPLGLASLRSRIAVAVAERKRIGEAETVPPPAPPPRREEVPRTSAPEVRELDGADAVEAQARGGEDDGGGEALRAAYAMAGGASERDPVVS